MLQQLAALEPLPTAPSVNLSSQMCACFEINADRCV